MMSRSWDWMVCVIWVLATLAWGVPGVALGDPFAIGSAVVAGCLAVHFGCVAMGDGETGR